MVKTGLAPIYSRELFFLAKRYSKTRSFGFGSYAKAGFQDVGVAGSNRIQVEL